MLVRDSTGENDAPTYRAAGPWANWRFGCQRSSRGISDGVRSRQLARVHTVPRAQLAAEARPPFGCNECGSRSVERYVPSSKGATETGMLAFQLATAL